MEKFMGLAEENTNGRGSFLGVVLFEQISYGSDSFEQKEYDNGSKGPNSKFQKLFGKIITIIQSIIESIVYLIYSLDC